MKSENLEKGKNGEIKVIYHLTSNKIEHKDYTSYEDHKHKQHKGYDIEVLNTTTNEWDRIDIKSNAKNGFIYLEATNDDKTKLGWFWTSSADGIYHYDFKEDKICGYELKKMRNFVYQNDLQPKFGKYKNLIGIKWDEIKFIKII